METLLDQSGLEPRTFRSEQSSATNVKWLSGGLCLFLILGLLLYQLRVWGITDIPWTAGDWMLVSCFLLAIAATWIARNLESQYEQTIVRLWQRGVLFTEPNRSPLPLPVIQAVIAKSTKRSSRFSLIGGMLFCFLVLVILGIGESRKFAQNPGIWLTLWNMLGVVLYVQIAFAAGSIVGRAVVCSTMALHLHSNDIGIEVMPGHPDGAAGLKPVGDLFIRQALIACLPVVFIGIWYTLIMISPPENPMWQSLQKNYVDVLRAAFFVFLAIELVGFILPMLRFHLEMKRQKIALQHSADELSQRITNLARQIITTRDQKEVIAIQSELDCLNKRHDEIELLPTWPVNWMMWFRFGVANLCLIIPVLIKLWIKLYMELPMQTLEN